MSGTLHIDDRPIPELLAYWSTQVSRTLLEAAIVYSGRGWPVFPVHYIVDGRCSCGDADCGSAGKHPLAELAPHGLRDATTDLDCIRAWWTRCPSANIGVRTGAASRLIVLDIDPAHGGEESLASLVKLHGALGDARQVRTGGGGRHLYYRHPGDGCVIKNSVGSLGPGLDVRGDGGYVVAPPSRTLKGQYVWKR